MVTPTGDTRSRLVDAAGQVFAEKGFRAANIREICQLALANVAAVNYYFGDKERLYLETVRAAYRVCNEQVPLPEWPTATPPDRKLRDFVQMLLSRILADREPAWHMQLWMRELAEPTAACAAWVQEYVRPMAAILIGIMAESVPHADLTQLHLLSSSVFGQCLHYRLNQPAIILLVGEKEYGTYTVDFLADHITRFTLAALGLAPPLGKAGGRP